MSKDKNMRAEKYFRIIIALLILYLLSLAITTITDAREKKILENGCPKCHCAYELDSYSYSKNCGYLYNYECPACHNHIYTSITLEEKK